ncbi:hypothetical protein BJX70DRAFT_362727 [Aspergillus crustosus]
MKMNTIKDPPIHHRPHLPLALNPSIIVILLILILSLLLFLRPSSLSFFHISLLLLHTSPLSLDTHKAGLIDT